MDIHFKKHFNDQIIATDSTMIGSLKLYYAAGAPDVELVQSYCKPKPSYEVLYFSIGETWTQIAPGLLKMFEDGPHPIDGHGYQLYPYGLPSFQKALRGYIERTQGFRECLRGRSLYETVVAAQGTRGAMFDFGRIIMRNRKGGKVPTVISTIPGWDYRGVFEPLGFRNATVTLRPEDGFVPSLDAYTQLAADIEKSGEFELALITINAQHNPTGLNWSPETVKALIQLARQHKAAILLDDPYFAIHGPNVNPTSALAILLDEIYGSSVFKSEIPWLAVRSLGKQFNCNGWALGAMTGEPEIIRQMCCQMLYSRTYPYGSLLQAVMERWIESADSDSYLREQGQRYLEKRRLLATFFIEELGFPEASVHMGECTSYMLVEVPPAYYASSHPADLFRRECFKRTGVLFGVGSLNVDGKPSSIDRYIRIYMGPTLDDHREALRRLKAEGFFYDARNEAKTTFSE